MSMIKVKVEPYANSATITAEILAAAAVGMPNSNPNAAEPIRDGNGKVVEVQVNLPDNDAPGLLNAKNKINENPGVSKSAEFPRVIADDNFDAGTPGTVLIDTTGGNNGPPSIPWNTQGNVGKQNLNHNPFLNFEVRLIEAYSAESVGASGSALMWHVGPGSGSFLSYAYEGRLEMPAVSNGLDPFLAVQYEYDILLPTTINSVATVNPDDNITLNLRFRARDGAGPGEAMFLQYNRSSSPNWIWRAPGQGAGLDTGIAVGTSHRIKLIQDLRPSSFHSLDIDGTLFVIPSLNAGVASFMDARFNYDARYTTSINRSSNEVPGVVFDNVKYTVLA